MEFQPFSVTCVTCGSRLRVGRPELAGNIVSCPKCQAMVQLTPNQSSDAGAPPAIDSPSTGPANAPGPANAQPIALGKNLVDSNALTEDSISTPELPDHQPSPGGFAEPPPVFQSDPTKTHSQEPLSGSDGSADSTVAPPPNWHSQKNAKSRKVVMSIAVVLASVLSASILFAVVSRNRSDSVAQQSPADATTESPIDSQPPRDEQDSLSDQATNLSDDAPESDLNQPADSDQQPTEPDKTLANVAEPDVTAGTENMQPPADLLPDNPLLGSNVLEGMPVFGGDPLDPAAESAADGSPDASKMMELPKDLQGLFDGISLDRPHIAPTQPAPKTIDEIQVDRAADNEVDIKVAMNRPKTVNMKQALGLSVALQATDPAGYPLNDLMLVLGQLTGVPIELEWVSFEIVGQPIDQPVKLPGKWQTIEEILTTVCDSSQATFDKNSTSITVRPTDERLQQAIEQILDLDDIITENETAVSTVRALLGQRIGNPARVTVPTESAAMQLAVLACESIRRVRGVKGKLSDQALARWAGTYRDQVSAWQRLENGISGPSRLQPTSFVSIVRQIARINGATCYINWQDGAKRSLGPTKKKMPQTGDAISAAEALRQVLDPENMHVRVVDSSHWWAGDDATFDRFPVVVWFDGEKDPGAVKTQIESILEGASVQEEVLGSVTIDPTSSLCIAILPRYLLRQLPRLLNKGP